MELYDSALIADFCFFLERTCCEPSSTYKELPGIKLRLPKFWPTRPTLLYLFVSKSAWKYDRDRISISRNELPYLHLGFVGLISFLKNKWALSSMLAKHRVPCIISRMIGIVNCSFGHIWM